MAHQVDLEEARLLLVPVSMRVRPHEFNSWIAYLRLYSDDSTISLCELLSDEACFR